MKKLTAIFVIIASSLFLFGCDDSKAPFDGSETQDSFVTGHYEASFFVIEGDCYDIENIDLVIFEGEIQQPYEELMYSIDGAVFMNGRMIGNATGDAFYPVSFDGDLEYDEFGGDWTTEECRGFFSGGKTRDLTDHEQHLYDAL